MFFFLIEKYRVSRIRPFTASIRPQDAVTKEIQNANSSCSIDNNSLNSANNLRPVTAPSVISSSNDNTTTTTTTTNTNNTNKVENKIDVSISVKEITINPVPPQTYSFQIGIFGIAGAGKTSLLNAIQGDYDSKTKSTLGELLFIFLFFSVFFSLGILT